ncbi:hypothetical protein BDN72DRAFT_835582 [Pluteus cervinus]|uniref:Uncharacterized protein n=1 Tax=Pluteus cervinus TaxID=181527 RepID=A0ACD3B4X2_9AGAR|nr:hypothetical protein BDN72DRAFT_835582 [Pluteus cervinus]
MCRLEVFGDWYRGCGHFVKAYYSGEKTDCYLGTCRSSENHIHRALECPCPKHDPVDERRIINMFQTTCDDCKGVAYPPRR